MAERSSKKVGLIVVLSVLIGIVATLCALFAYLGITLNSLKDDTLVKLNDGSMVSVEECEPDDCTPGAEIVFTVEDKEYTIRYVRGTVVGMEKAEDGTEQIKVEAEGQLTLISFESIIGIFKKSLPGLLVTLSNTIIDDSKLNVIGMEKDPEENTGSDIPELERDEAWELMQLLNFRTPYQYLKWAGKLDYNDPSDPFENPSAIGIYTEEDLVNILSKHYTEEYIQRNFIELQRAQNNSLYWSAFPIWREENGKLIFLRDDGKICSFVESTFDIQKVESGEYTLTCEMKHPVGENWVVKARAFYEEDHYKIDIIEEDESADIPELDFATALDLVKRADGISFLADYFSLDNLLDENNDPYSFYAPIAGVSSVDEMVALLERYFTTESIYEYIINVENPGWYEDNGRIYVPFCERGRGYFNTSALKLTKISEGIYVASFWFRDNFVTHGMGIDMKIIYDTEDAKYKLEIYGKNKDGFYSDFPGIDTGVTCNCPKCEWVR